MPVIDGVKSFCEVDENENVEESEERRKLLCCCCFEDSCVSAVFLSETIRKGFKKIIGSVVGPYTVDMMTASSLRVWGMEAEAVLNEFGWYRFQN